MSQTLRTTITATDYDENDEEIASNVQVVENSFTSMVEFNITIADDDTATYTIDVPAGSTYLRSIEMISDQPVDYAYTAVGHQITVSKAYNFSENLAALSVGAASVDITNNSAAVANVTVRIYAD